MSDTIKILQICDHEIDSNSYKLTKVNLCKTNGGVEDVAIIRDINAIGKEINIRNAIVDSKICVNKVLGNTIKTTGSPGSLSGCGLSEAIVITLLHEDKTTATTTITLNSSSTALNGLELHGFYSINSDIADYVDIDNKKIHFLIKKKILNGSSSEDWKYHTTSDNGFTRFYLEIDDAAMIDKDKLGCIATRFDTISYDDIMEMSKSGIAMNYIDGGVLISIANTNINYASTDTPTQLVTKFKTWLSTNSTYLLYKREYEEITDATSKISAQDMLVKSGVEEISSATTITASSPILDITYKKYDEVQVVSENDFDIICSGVVDRIDSVYQGNKIFIEDIDYKLFTHNKILWISKSKPMVGTVYTVKYKEVNNELKKYSLESCPRCCGNGWYIDISDTNKILGTSYGANKLIQDYIKILMTKKHNNIGTNLVTLTGKEVYDENELETAIMSCIKDAETQCKKFQSDFSALTGVEVEDEERLNYVNIDEIYYDKLSGDVIINLTLHNYLNDNIEIDLKL